MFSLFYNVNTALSSIRLPEKVKVEEIKPSRKRQAADVGGGGNYSYWEAEVFLKPHAESCPQSCKANDWVN